MTECVFCRIRDGAIAADKVFENEKTFAILDINPISWGHTLVLPRDHYETWTDLPPEILAELATAAQTVARGIVKAAKAEGFNLLMNNHRCSGQAIPHAHFHVIPRKTGDGVKYNWATKPYDGDAVKKVVEQIREALK